MGSKLFFALVGLLSACTASSSVAENDHVTVLYHVALANNDIVEISVYNPNEFRVCVSALNWPGAVSGDVLVLMDANGRRWHYKGMELETMGEPMQVAIDPQSSISANIDVRKQYSPEVPDARIAAVYYGAAFVRCH